MSVEALIARRLLIFRCRILKSCAYEISQSSHFLFGRLTIRSNAWAVMYEKLLFSAN